MRQVPVVQCVIPIAYISIGQHVSVYLTIALISPWKDLQFRYFGVANNPENVLKRQNSLLSLRCPLRHAQALLRQMSARWCD